MSLVFWADQRSNSRAGSAHGPSSHTQHVRFVQRAAFGALCSADDSVRGSGYLIAPGFRSDRHTRASMALPNPSRQGVAAAGDLKFAATSDVTLGPHIREANAANVVGTARPAHFVFAVVALRWSGCALARGSIAGPNMSVATRRHMFPMTPVEGHSDRGQFSGPAPARGTAGCSTPNHRIITSG